MKIEMPKRKISYRAVRRIEERLRVANEDYKYGIAVSCQGAAQGLLNQLVNDEKVKDCHILVMSPVGKGNITHKVGGPFLKHYAVLVFEKNGGVVLDNCFNIAIPFDDYLNFSYENPEEVQITVLRYHFDTMTEREGNKMEKKRALRHLELAFELVNKQKASRSFDIKGKEFEELCKHVKERLLRLHGVQIVKIYPMHNVGNLVHLNGGEMKDYEVLTLEYHHWGFKGQFVFDPMLHSPVNIKEYPEVAFKNYHLVCFSPVLNSGGK